MSTDSLALLANTLVKYQPVAIYTSPSDVSYMRSKLNSTVEVVEFTASRRRGAQVIHSAFCLDLSYDKYF